MRGDKHSAITFVVVAGIVGSIAGILEVFFSETILWELARDVVLPNAFLLFLAWGAIGYALCSAAIALLFHIIARGRHEECATAVCIPIFISISGAALSMIRGGILQYVFFIPASLLMALALCLALRRGLLWLKLAGSLETWLALHAALLSLSIIAIAASYGETWRWFGLPAGLAVMGCAACFAFFRNLKRRAGLLALANAMAVVVLAAVPPWPEGAIKGAMAGQRPINVLLITIDTLRSDRLGCYGFKSAHTPNIDEIASQGVLFSETVAPAPITGPSHASILTGLYPVNHGAIKNGVWLSRAATTLPELLAERGYYTAAFVSGWTLKNQACGLAARFHVYGENFGPWRWLPEEALRLRLVNLAALFGFEPNLRPGRNERIAARTTEAALRWLSAARDRPFFLWVHYFDPHAPYNPPPPYDKLHDPNYQGSIDLDWYSLSPAQHEKLVQNRRGLEHMRARYDGEISYVDAQIGRLRKALKDWQLDSNTLVVLTADHGESLGEHNQYFGHGDLYDTCLRVPLIFNFPERRWAGRRIDGQTRLIDIAPTILDYLKVDAGVSFDGKSLLPLIGDGEPKEGEAAFACLIEEGKTIFCVRDKGYKLIRTSAWWADTLRFSAREELYDLRADPGESNNIAADAPPVLAELRQALALWRKQETPRQPALSKDIREKLRTLGYIQ